MGPNVPFELGERDGEEGEEGDQISPGAFPKEDPEPDPEETKE